MPSSPVNTSADCRNACLGIWRWPGSFPVTPDLHVWPGTAVFLVHLYTQGDNSRYWAGWDHSAVLSLFADAMGYDGLRIFSLAS